MYQETHFEQEYVLYISNQTFSKSKLAFIFFKIVMFFVVLVVRHLRSALPRSLLTWYNSGMESVNGTVITSSDSLTKQCFGFAY